MKPNKAEHRTGGSFRYEALARRSSSTRYGIETVTVTHVGTEARRTNLAADAEKGANEIKVRDVRGFHVGDRISVGTPANQQTVTITAVGSGGPSGAGIEFTPALEQAHIRDEGVVEPGPALTSAHR